MFCWHGFLRSLPPCLPGLLAHWSDEGGINAVAILDWMMKMVFSVIQIGLGPLELMRTCFSLVINVVFLHGPARGRRPGSWRGTMRGQMRTVLRDVAGALGASVIVHDVVLRLLIAMTIISLLKWLRGLSLSLQCLCCRECSS